MSKFMANNNIQLLWEVLLDEIKVDKTNTKIISNIKLVFDKNTNLFSSKLNPKASLIEANKHFLSQMVIAINKLFPNMSTPKLININNDESIMLDPYKIEDIQSARQTDFENQYEKRKNEFESLINTPKPKEIDLSYKISEGKITAMDNLIADKMAERENDIAIMSDPNAQKWLQPRETSVKNANTNTNTNTNTNNSSKLKHINIQNDNITLNISDNLPSKKKVSWDDNEPNMSSIFSKLKVTTESKKSLNIDSNSNSNSELDLYLESELNSKYVEQKSVSLLELEKEKEQGQKHIKQPVNESPIINNPLISNVQIIKQINELTNKINYLTNIVSILSQKTEENTNKLFEIVSLLHKTNNNINIHNPEDSIIISSP
jgi:hypothetical protein